MAGTQWYVHIQGQTIGPLTLDAILAMLQQNRLQFADFIWREPLLKWMRISEFDEFTQYMPAYPSVRIPERGALNEKSSSYAREESAEEEAAAPVEKMPEKKAAKKAPPPKLETKTEAKSPKQWPSVRRFFRIPIKGVADLAENGKFPLVDISEGGVFLAAKENMRLPVGTELKINFSLPGVDKALAMQGVVIRHGESFQKVGFAVEFIRVNPAHKRLLSQWILEHAP